MVVKNHDLLVALINQGIDRPDADRIAELAEEKSISINEAITQYKSKKGAPETTEVKMNVEKTDYNREAWDRAVKESESDDKKKSTKR